MGLFNKSSIEKLLKYFQSKNINPEKKDNVYQFELVLSDKNISLYPYFCIDDEKHIFSMCLNLKKYDNKKEDILPKIIDFNNQSRFFKMKYEGNVLYLEYNTFFKDNLNEIVDGLIENVFMMSNEIENL